MFGAISKATNSSFQKGMTFCRIIYESMSKFVKGLNSRRGKIGPVKSHFRNV